MSNYEDDANICSECGASKSNKAMTSTEFAELFSNYVNNMSLNTEQTAEKLVRDHPTLQQSKFRVMMSAIKLWADMYDANRYDLRNQYTCEMSKKIMKLFEEDSNSHIYIPHI